MNILILEDTYLLREQISEYFTFLGHSVTECHDGNSFFELNDYSKFDLFLIDLNLPDYNGVEILEFLNEEKIKVPRVVLTANADIRFMKNSFKNGCCEYLKKPFSLEELEIRVERFFSRDTNIFTIDDKFYFDKEKNQLFTQSREVELTKLHKKIILYLLINRDRVCSQDEIIDNISPDKLIELSTLASHIKNIRKATTPAFIVTVRGEGYRMQE